MPLAEVAAQFLFQVIAERAEKAAVIMTTNLPFSDWTQVIPNPRLCNALLDRITNRADIIETGTRRAKRAGQSRTTLSNDRSERKGIGPRFKVAKRAKEAVHRGLQSAVLGTLQDGLHRRESVTLGRKAARHAGLVLYARLYELVSE